jgi:hypothetical protein
MTHLCLNYYGGLCPSPEFIKINTFRKLVLLPSSGGQNTKENLLLDLSVGGLWFENTSTEEASRVGLISYPVHLKTEIQQIYEM